MLLSIFLYNFMIRAFLIGALMALGTALISNYLVSSNQALIGDGLAHISFTGVVLGILLSNWPLLIAIPFSILAALVIRLLMRLKLEGDSAIGLVATFVMAIGFIIISLAKGFNKSVESMLVGSLFSTTWADVVIILIVVVILIIFILTSYRTLFSITFDNNYAKFNQIKVAFYDYSLTILTAVLVVIGVQTIGALLISAFIIFPAVSAGLVARSFKHMIFLSLIINLFVTLIGIFSAHYLLVPAGSLIIVFHGLLFIILYSYKKIARLE
ncbi:MAG: metal ABC transporter permease [Acholeplasmatales bacterium]|nr:metal ABC transporter permease [Acholeplasmataceae bacterium]MCK9289493.1 metal ABC transporter permease [Acholeplasmataceae bacterium]MCK9427118.1 metal ABC transporter permease [Acholeplasmataceae bacterium]MDY0114942.1 metal ABC transporter permease [Acholeplasmatales bacterium]HHT39804.1 metal ABC transporter permease [Acholeplasmataceae bacterium]